MSELKSIGAEEAAPRLEVAKEKRAVPGGGKPRMPTDHARGSAAPFTPKAIATGDFAGVRRICFIWNGTDAEKVEIADYH
jgi:hypothetical protein